MKTNNTATITRLQVEVANPNIESWTSLGTINVMFLPLSDQMRQIAVAQGITGKAYKLFAEASEDIQATDRVTIDSTEYDVRGIKKYEGSKTGIDHLEILIEEREL